MWQVRLILHTIACGLLTTFWMWVTGGGWKTVRECVAIYLLAVVAGTIWNKISPRKEKK